MIAVELVLSALLMVARKRAEGKGILDNVWEKEMEWGFGQIIAPFSWAPLLIELGFAILGTVRYRRRGRTSQYSPVLPELRWIHHVGDNNGTGLESQRGDNGVIEGEPMSILPAQGTVVPSIGEA